MSPFKVRRFPAATPNPCFFKAGRSQGQLPAGSKIAGPGSRSVKPPSAPGPALAGPDGFLPPAGRMRLAFAMDAIVNSTPIASTDELHLFFMIGLLQKRFAWI